MTTRRCSRSRGDAGSIAVEVAVVAPAFVFLLLLVVYAGRVSEADGSVQRAASEAARAASLRQHPLDAEQDARQVAEANLSAAGVVCRRLAVDVGLDDFAAGGTVDVVVTCDASMSDVTLLGVPGSRVFQARAVEVIDYHRGGG